MDITECVTVLAQHQVNNNPNAIEMSSVPKKIVKHHVINACPYIWKGEYFNAVCGIWFRTLLNYDSKLEKD